MSATKSSKNNDKTEVRRLIADAVAAEENADAARKQAQLAKAKFKEARKAFKQAKKTAKRARKAAKAAARLFSTTPPASPQPTPPSRAGSGKRTRRTSSSPELPPSDPPTPGPTEISTKAPS